MGIFRNFYFMIFELFNAETNHKLGYLVGET